MFALLDRVRSLCAPAQLPQGPVISLSPSQRAPAPLERRTLHPNLTPVLRDMLSEARFIEEAKSVLGYSASLEVHRALRSLGVEPFTSESVDAYMWAEATKENIRRHGTRERLNQSGALQDEWDVSLNSIRKEGWKAIPIAGYKEWVPESVVGLALEIKSLLPGAMFSVVSFMPQNVIMRTLDPFLRLDYEGHGYYVAVWDEPGFNDKLVY